jgi:integrase/recombinase XerD
MSTVSLSALLQGFFTDRLLRQLRASPHTVAAYRDTFRLLLRFAVEHVGQPSTKLRLERLDATFVGQFLDYLESKRGNTARTRNMRLAAIRSFFRYVALCEPAYALQCERVLSMPDKRHVRHPVAFLSRPEIEAVPRCSVQGDMDRPPRSRAPPGRGPNRTSRFRAHPA